MLELPAPCQLEDEEIARDLMIVCVIGLLAPEHTLDFETHCLSCEECLTKLVIVLHLMCSPLRCEEEALAPLHAIGVEAAMIARRRAAMKAPISTSDEWPHPGQTSAVM